MKISSLSAIVLMGLLAFACGDSDTPNNPESESDASLEQSEDSEEEGGEPVESSEDASSDDEEESSEEDTSSSESNEEDVSEEEAREEEEEEEEEEPEESGPSWPELVINEVAPAGEPADWVEIVNRSQEDVDLGGWSITDEDPEHVHDFDAGQVLAAGAYLLLLKEDAGGFTFGLGDADSLTLYAPDGSVVDTTTWSDEDAPQTTSWGRMPNGTGDFMTLETPTPGGANASNAPQDCGNDAIELGEVCDGSALDGESCEGFNFASGELACSDACDAFDTSGCVPPSRIVVINEVTSSEDDRIELLNVSIIPVVISGWTLSDKDTAEPDQLFTIPPGLSLAPGDYVVFTKDVDHSFGLGGNDKLVLRDEAGVLIDRVNWAKDEAEVSYCLIPDGGETAQVCEEATFGGSND